MQTGPDPSLVKACPPSNTTVIGNGQEWNDSTGSWQTVNWQTAGYWASLRAAAPLAQDDGLNFLRLNHPAPFNVQYWEVGNEEYGSWEIDRHTAQHDPATCIAFAKQFATYAAAIDPTISIGLDVQSPGSDFNNWIANILQQSIAQSFTPGFLSDHNYVQAPGSESDSNLLLDFMAGVRRAITALSAAPTARRRRPALMFPTRRTSPSSSPPRSSRPAATWYRPVAAIPI